MRKEKDGQVKPMELAEQAELRKTAFSDPGVKPAHQVTCRGSPLHSSPWGSTQRLPSPPFSLFQEVCSLLSLLLSEVAGRWQGPKLHGVFRL